MKKFSAFLVVLVFVFIGCGGKEEIKLSPDSKLAAEALNSINNIKTAYERKDRDALQNRLAPMIAEEVLKELSFDRAELSFIPRMVRINNFTVMVNLNWHGTWVIKGNNVINRGVSVFVFEDSPMKLIRIEGDNPFIVPLGRE